MQCASYSMPVYHARDLNSRHVLDSNANNGEEKGYDISSRPYCLSYDKEVLRQIIQSHDATFRYQVQELHRLYIKQRELMDEMRVRKIFTQYSQSQTSQLIHSSSHARSDISHATPHETSWFLLGDRSHSKLSDLTSSENIHQLPKFMAPNQFQEHMTLHSEPFVRKNKLRFLPLISNNGNENRIIDLEILADVPRFKEKNISEALKLASDSPEKLPNFRPATDSETDSVKTGDFSSFDLNSRRSRCLFDLNEPILLESLLSSSKCQMETCFTEIMHNNNHNDSGFLNSDGSSDDTNSSVLIDLNSMPDGLFPETETNLENIRIVKMETTEFFDECIDTEIDNELLKTGKDTIDLNTDAVLNETLSPTAQMKSAGDGDLEGPVSPENEECSPPRGESEENSQLDIQFTELETAAAEILVTISSSRANGCLSWFAEIVSATGDDIEEYITKLKNDSSSTYNDKCELLLVSDFGPNFSDENKVNVSHVVEKENEIGSMLAASPQKCRTRGTRRHKSSKDVWEIEGFFETDSSRRKTGNRACSKPKKYSKVVKISDRVKKPMNSILKQPATRSKEGVLQSWGKIKKRENGLRRKASTFIIVS